MRKFMKLLPLALAIGLLTACGESYEAESSTVFVLKDGRIVSTDVESFDADTYDEAGLRAYIEDAVAEYTGANGEGTVALKELTVEEGTATLILEYASAADYAGFNGTSLYAGTVSDALAAGYSFDGEFAAVADGEALPCGVGEFLGSDYKVVVFQGNMNVHVAGTIAYVSVQNTAWVDESTIAIQEGTNLLGQEVSTEGTEGAAETVDGTEADTEDATEIDEAALSDSDEDLLAASKEDTEVIFEFEEEEPKEPEEVNEFSNIYTYIVYK